MARGRFPKLAAEVKGASVVEINGTYRIFLEHDGQKKTIEDWAASAVVGKRTLYTRIFIRKWPVEKALAKELLKQEKHGGSRTPEYTVWSSMKDRCLNNNDPAYKDYGERGVGVCERWIASFSAFIEDVGRRPTPKHQLERVNNDGNYEPENVEWATKSAQMKNMRSNVDVTFEGRTMILKDWAREYGIPNTTLWNRLNVLGWDLRRSLTTPSGPNGRKSR